MGNGEQDIWRDTWVRYLGYANEIGEAFRHLVPRPIVRASYGVAMAYTLADTGDKGYKMYKKDGRPKSVIIETGDALIWQTLASVLIPGFVINRICAISHIGLSRKFPNMSLRSRNWLTVSIGLASIPFIVGPIDNGTTYIMDNTYRKFMQPWTPDPWLVALRQFKLLDRACKQDVLKNLICSATYEEYYILLAKQ